MKKYFSISTGGFYIDVLRAEYEAAGTWPKDAVEVTPEEGVLLREALTSGATISKKSGRKWNITARPEPSFEILAASYLATVRQARDVVLNRLAGIGFAAMAISDADTVTEITAARSALLDITTCTPVASAQDMDALQDAIIAEWDRIAAPLSGEARRAFDGAGVNRSASPEPTIATTTQENQ